MKQLVRLRKKNSANFLYKYIAALLVCCLIYKVCLGNIKWKHSRFWLFLKTQYFTSVWWKKRYFLIKLVEFFLIIKRYKIQETDRCQELSYMLRVPLGTVHHNSVDKETIDWHLFWREKDQDADAHRCNNWHENVIHRRKKPLGYEFDGD